MNNHVVETDWAGLTFGEQVQHLEVEGFVVLPDILCADEIERLKAQTSRFETQAVDYSPRQRYCPNVQFVGGAITELIAHPPTI